jgi:hypothetical protein
MLLGFWAVPALYAQSGINNENLKIKLWETSHLTIHGKTNVNQFQCEYDNMETGDTLDMRVYWIDDCFVFENANIRLRTEGFDCGNKMMNNDFYDLLQSDKYPNVTVEINCIDVGLLDVGPNVPVSNLGRKATVQATFHIAGRTGQYAIPVTVDRMASDRVYRGSIDLDITDFGLEPPQKMLGLVQVDETITISFLIKISLIDHVRAAG